MSLKQLLQIYNICYVIYREAIKNHAYDRDGVVCFCKTRLAQEPSLKGFVFYSLRCRRDDREWSFGLHLSFGEANAFMAYIDHKRDTKKHYSLELESNTTCSIYELSLDTILANHALLDSLVDRLAVAQPFIIDDTPQSDDDNDIKTFWNFESRHEPHCIYYNGKEFLFSTHEDAKLVCAGYGYSVLIDEDGRYGVVYNKTKLLSGAPEFEIALDFEYYYIKKDRLLVEVQKEKPTSVDNFKEYRCDIVDLETKKFYTDNQNALCNSLNGENFITVDVDGYLIFNFVDTKQKQIVAKSKPYLQIINPICYAPKPVQDIKTGLWGYINKECKEIIPTKFDDWNFFGGEYAVLQDENGKSFVIDINGDVVIEAIYDELQHHEGDLFFVKQNGKCAALKKDKIYIDFMDANEDYVSTLTRALSEAKSKLHSKRYEMSLAEYVRLFEPFVSEEDLREAGLLRRPVKIKKLAAHHKKIIEDIQDGRIGWEYPSSADMYDMSVEIPVIFAKKSGGALSLGVRLEDVELRL